MEFVLSGIEFAYKRRNAEPARILKRLDLKITSGEFVCIVGPSGCGKTTLLNILAGFLKPTGGSITLEGISNRITPPIAMVFQEYALFPWRRVLDNIAFGLEMAHVDKKKRYEAAQDYLNMVGLAGYEQHFPHELSGGMKQRVAIARALANDPAVLLMDEPLGSLDAQTRVVLQRELVKIWQKTKKTIIYVTHSIDEAAYLGDRVIVLSTKPTVIRQEISIALERPRSEAAMLPYRTAIWDLINSEISQEMGKGS